MNKRVAVANSNQFGVCKGMTGTIVCEFRARMFDVELDCEVKMDGRNKVLAFFESELYFPDSPLGYNQKCFQNN
jgi:hypothetical protein